MPSGNDADDEIGRRNALQTLGAGVVGLSVPTSTAVVASQTATNSVTKTIRVSPSDTGMTDTERSRFIDRMEEKYGREAASTVSLDHNVSTYGKNLAQSPGEVVWSDQESGEVNNSFGDVLVEADYYAELYETDVFVQGSNKRFYFYWMWSAAQSIDHGYVQGNIQKIWSQIKVNNGNVLTYDPGGDITRNGFPVTVSGSVSGQSPTGTVGASAGISGEFMLSQDTVGPYPIKTDAGEDKFAVRWKGDYEGTQEINGTMTSKRPDNQGQDFEWTISLDGSGI